MCDCTPTTKQHTQHTTTELEDAKEPIICRKLDDTPRAIYADLSEARVAILLAKQYRQNLFAYNCRLCNDIHVRPIGSIAPPTHCSYCKKTGYESEEDAQQVADKRYNKSLVRLVVYCCPYSDEYHLTKG